MGLQQTRTRTLVWNPSASHLQVLGRSASICKIWNSWEVTLWVVAIALKIRHCHDSWAPARQIDHKSLRVVVAVRSRHCHQETYSPWPSIAIDDEVPESMAVLYTYAHHYLIILFKLFVSRFRLVLMFMLVISRLQSILMFMWTSLWFSTGFMVYSSLSLTSALVWRIISFFQIDQPHRP